MGTKIRLAVIALLLVASVLADSTFYISSALMDGFFNVLIIIVALPLVKQLIKK